MKKDRIQECTELANEIIKNFELSELPIGSILMKALRLCRLLGDEDGILLFRYEVSGYPQDNNGYLTGDAWRIGEIAGRHFIKKEKEENKTYMDYTNLAEIEESIHSNKERLKIAYDPSVSVSSANPNEFIGFSTRAIGNNKERNEITNEIKTKTSKLSKYRGKLYDYILNIYNKLAYGNVVEDVFTQNRLIVNNNLAKICPNALQKFVSVYENIDSANPEDWANAVHSCRRIIKEVADNLYPPQDTPIEVNGKKVKIGEEQYVNRLIQYIETKSSSATYSQVIGSTLSHIGERIDATVNAVCKGTHTEVSKDEAERYIIYTYLLLGDILKLKDVNTANQSIEKENNIQ